MPATPHVNNADNAAATLHSLLTLPAAAGLFHHPHITTALCCSANVHVRCPHRVCTDRLLCYTYYKYDDDEVVFASAISFFSPRARLLFYFFVIFSDVSVCLFPVKCTCCSCKLQRNIRIVKICCAFNLIFSLNSIQLTM